MAIPHYVYLVLKMPGPNGVISLQGDLKRSYDCDKEAVEFAATRRVPNALEEVFMAAKKLKTQSLEIPTKEDGPAKVAAPKEVVTKPVDLVEGDSSKTAVIGAALSPK